MAKPSSTHPPPQHQPSQVVLPIPPPPAAGPVASDLAITLDVEPRKPRLAWQGMEWGARK